MIKGLGYEVQNGRQFGNSRSCVQFIVYTTGNLPCPIINILRINPKKIVVLPLELLVVLILSK